jgi:hypothetical protein
VCVGGSLRIGNVKAHRVLCKDDLLRSISPFWDGSAFCKTARADVLAQDRATRCDRSAFWMVYLANTGSKVVRLIYVGNIVGKLGST